MVAHRLRTRWQESDMVRMCERVLGGREKVRLRYGRLVTATATAFDLVLQSVPSSDFPLQRSVHCICGEGKNLRSFESPNIYFPLENFFSTLQPTPPKQSIFVSPEWTSRGKHIIWHRASHNYPASLHKRYRKAMVHTFSPS